MPDFNALKYKFKSTGTKAACKMLMTLTPTVNFTNILLAAFLYESVFCSFSLLTVWLGNFLVKEYRLKGCS
jgi:hypothetical protein